MHVSRCDAGAKHRFKKLLMASACSVRCRFSHTFSENLGLGREEAQVGGRQEENERGNRRKKDRGRICRKIKMEIEWESIQMEREKKR